MCFLGMFVECHIMVIFITGCVCVCPMHGVVVYAFSCHASVLCALMCSALILGPAPSLPRLTISYGKTNVCR